MAHAPEAPLCERPWFRHYPPGVRPDLAIPDEPFYAAFYRQAVAHPDRAALLYFGTRIPYRRLAQMVDGFAAWLAHLGVAPSDRVGIMLPNCPQAVVAIYGCMRRGALPALINPLNSPREVEQQTREVGARVFITLDLLAQKAAPALAAAGVQRLVLTRVQDCFPWLLRLLYPLKLRRQGVRVQVPSNPAVTWWRPGATAAGTPPAPPAVDPGRDPAALFFTGGTTGVSKAVAASHRNLVAQALQVNAFIRRPGDPPEVILCVMPLFHVYGFMNGLCAGLSFGHTVVLIPRFDPGLVLAAIRKYRPTSFPGVPTIYTALLRRPDLARYNLRSIRLCASGAAPMPVELMQQWEQVTGGVIVEGYGLTETCAATHINPRFGVRKPGSVGIPLPGVDCRIVDVATGQDLPPGEVGEVVVRGPNVALGYWQRPEETALAFRDGWLYTGDVGRMDEDGYLYIVDRKKDMVISGGYNVYPREIDEVLYQYPKVLEACAVGVPDPYRGESIKAFVVLRPGETATAEEIIAWCRERLAAYKVPRAVEFVPELPKSAVGKVLRRVLAERERQKGQVV